MIALRQSQQIPRTAAGITNKGNYYERKLQPNEDFNFWYG